MTALICPKCDVTCCANTEAAAIAAWNRRAFTASVPADAGEIAWCVKSLRGLTSDENLDAYTPDLRFILNESATALETLSTSLSDKDAEIGRLREALTNAAKRMKNVRGAIETNQVEDKDARRQLSNGIAVIEAVLEGKFA